MKKIILKAIFCLMLVTCKTPATLNKFVREIKESYIYDFKITYFKRILIEGFNKSEAIKSVMASDRSGYGEPILTMDDYRVIDSITAIDGQIIIKDSLQSIGRVSEGSQGKHVFTYALNKFQSNWLDSLAEARYKIFAKNFNSKY